MENFYLSALVGEVCPYLTGRRIGRVLLAGSQMLFDLRAADGRGFFVSLNRTNPALFLADRPLKQFAKESNSASPFAAHLRKYVAGAEIITITKPPLDRIVHVELERFDLGGGRERSRLVLALTGRSANAYLFDSQKGLIAMLDERGELPGDDVLDIEAGGFDPSRVRHDLREGPSQAEIEEKY